jgi:hypothetical protein
MRKHWMALMAVLEISDQKLISLRTFWMHPVIANYSKTGLNKGFSPAYEQNNRLKGTPCIVETQGVRIQLDTD